MTNAPDHIFDELAYALDKEAYERLCEQSPLVASALQKAIANGATRERVSAFLRARYPHLDLKARWIEQAARYLEKMVQSEEVHY